MSCRSDPSTSQVHRPARCHQNPSIDGTVLGQSVTDLRVIFGPRDDWFDNPGQPTTGEWLVSPHSNRVGLRLDRPTRRR